MRPFSYRNMTALTLVAMLGLAGCGEDNVADDTGPSSTRDNENVVVPGEEEATEQVETENLEETQELADDRLDTEIDRETAYENRQQAADVPNDQAELPGGTDNPFALNGRAVSTPEGERFGSVSDIVVNEAQDVFAVIELDAASASGSDQVVVPTQELQLAGEDVLLSSQASPDTLQPYNPEDYQPMGQRNEP